MFKPVPAKEAARICGFDSVAMLDYLERSGVFIPRRRRERVGRGKPREYDFRDLLVLKAIKQLLDSGASVATMKRALREFQNARWSADQATLEGRDGPLRYALISNGDLILVKSSKELYDLSMDGQMVFGFMIDLDKLHTDLCQKVMQQPLPL